MSSRGPLGGMSRRSWVVGLPLLIWSWLVWRDLWRWAQSAADLPRWDMAKYGAAASRMQHAMESWDLAALVGEIHRLSSWPFVVPLIEGWVFTLFGNDVTVARSLMVVFFAATCCLSAYLAWRLGENELEGQLILLWTLPLLLTSPMLNLYGVLNMLEIPGVTFSLIALALYWRVLRSPLDGSRWWALGIACCLLFFCKYNYGLIWLAAMGLAEIRRRQGSWRQVGPWLLGCLTRHAWGPWQIFLAVFLTLLAWLRWRGGLEVEVGPLQVHATSIGNPVYGLLVLTVGRYLVLPYHRRRWLVKWRQAQASTRILGWSLGLPVLLWMLVPPHCKDFFGFVENRSSDLDRWSLDSWWFYGRSLGDDFLAWPALTWPILLLAAWSCCRLPRLPLRLQVLTLWVVLHGAALVAHPYKLPRFAVTLFVPLLLLAARGGVDILARLQWQRRGRGRRAAAGWHQVWVPATLLLWVGMHWPMESTAVQTSPRLQEWQQRFSAQTVPAAGGGLVDRVVQLAGTEETAVLGTWNLFSPSLIQWRQAQISDGGPDLWVGRSLQRRLRRRGMPPQVLVLELLPSRWRPDLVAAHGLETAPIEARWQALRDREGVEASMEEWTAAGYRLHIYRHVPDDL